MTVKAFYKTFDDVFGIGDGDDPPFTPAQIPGLSSWYDASDTSTITEDAAFEVSNLADKSNNDLDLQQPVKSERPLTGSQTMNGLNVIYFDGIDDCLIRDDYPLAADDMTCFMVFNPISVATNADSCIGFLNTQRFQFDSNSVSQFRADLSQSGLGAGQLRSPNDLLGQDIVFVFSFDSVADIAIMRINGVEVDTTTYTGTLPNLSTLRVAVNRAADAHLEMDLGELVVYNRALSGSEIVEVEEYLIPKWIFDPTEIDGLFLWIDPSDASTITEVANAVSQIDDKSASGFDLVQAVGARQPLTNTATINGLNALQYDGTDDNLGAAITGVNPSMTFLMVFQPITVGSAEDAAIHLDGPTADFQVVSGSTSEYLSRLETVNLGAVNFNTDVDVLGLPTILAIRFNATDTEMSLWINGEDRIIGPYNGNLDATGDIETGINLADTEFLNMNMGEMLVYNSALSDTDLNRATTYLREKWIVPVLPDDIDDLIAWYDPSETSTITEAPGGLVNNITNKAGGDDLSQDVESEKPLTGAANINGLNAITFDGISQFLLASALTSGGSDLTLFMVLKPNVPVNFILEDSAISFFATNDFQVTSTHDGKSFNPVIATKGLGANFIEWGQNIYNQNSLLTARFSSADGTISIQVNDAAQAVEKAGYNGNLSANAILQVGTDSSVQFNLGMNMGELVIYDRDLTTGEIEALQRSLISKWRIA